MIGLIAYGSLMHPDELASHCTREPPVLPVRVRGYRRTFCQESTWRGGHSESRGVLTVEPSENSWFNAILVAECDPDLISSLDFRERGYDRIDVPTASVEPYAPDTDLGGFTAINMYRGRPEKWNADLIPNPDYVALCTAAAERWGPIFLDDFLATTYSGGVPLELGEPGRPGKGGRDS
ncbi:MAG: gamma-glutamylcyclotransferase family protein [Gemmatimonadota bacterium]